MEILNGFQTKMYWEKVRKYDNKEIANQNYKNL